MNLAFSLRFVRLLNSNKSPNSVDEDLHVYVAKAIDTYNVQVRPWISLNLRPLKCF